MTALVGATATLLIAIAAGLCFATEDQQPPQTGAIEVEVVYEDTGEPVEDVLVFVARDEHLVGHGIVSEGHLSLPVGTAAPGSTYDVVIGHVPAHGPWGNATSSTFIGPYPRPLEEAEFLPGEEVARVRFEVERGWRLRGTVRRQDGSAFGDGIVSVVQREAGATWAFGITDADGRFDMLGIVPAEHAEVVVATALSSDMISSGVVGSATLVRRSVALSGDCTSVDLDVETVTVDLALEVCSPLWPFPRTVPDLECVGHIWAAEVSEDEYDQGDIILVPSGLRPTRRFLGVKRYDLPLGEFPAGASITAALGFRESGEDLYLPQRLSWCSWRRVALGTGHQTIGLRAYEPNARLSRALWFVVFPVLVLAVCVPILVKQLRKRRAKGAAA
jgi:hypothetical protein